MPGRRSRRPAGGRRRTPAGTPSSLHLQIEAVHERAGRRRTELIQGRAGKTEPRQRRRLGPFVGIDREALDDSAAIEHDHDVFAAILGIGLGDQHDPVAERLGELDFAQRRRAGDTPAPYDRVPGDLRDPDLCRAAAFDDERPAIHERPPGLTVSSLGRTAEGAAILGNRAPLLGRLLLHDRPVGSDDELRPGAIGELLRPPRGSARPEASEYGRRGEAVRRLEHVQRTVSLDREVRDAARHRNRYRLGTAARPVLHTAVHLVEESDPTGYDVECGGADETELTRAGKTSLTNIPSPRSIDRPCIGLTRSTKGVDAEIDLRGPAKRQAPLRRHSPARRYG